MLWKQSIYLAGDDQILETPQVLEMGLDVGAFPCGIINTFQIFSDLKVWKYMPLFK